ncbi:MAG: hypothetical protein ABEH38_07930 [Flavobacteriales bacterium]
MYHLKFVLLIFSSMVLSGAVFAQNELSDQKVKELEELKEKLEGTYQIQMMGTRGRPSIPIKVFEKIKSRRKDQKVSFYSVDANTRIKILPRERIEQEGFEGVKERVVYIKKP